MQKFELLKTETVYTGRAFRVEMVDARMPDGNVRRFDLVRHPGAVTIIPLQEGKLFFVRQYRFGADDALLELPAGTLHPGEDPAVCAAREVREEIGMAAGKLDKLGEFYLAPGYSTEYMHVFLAGELYSDQLPGDDDEFLQVEAIPVDQVLQMARDNRLNDGKTLAALLLALPYLTSGE